MDSPFLKIGIILAILRFFGKIPDIREELIVCRRGVIIEGRTFLMVIIEIQYHHSQQTVCFQKIILVFEGLVH